MEIGVIGLGHVGLPTAASPAVMRHTVTGWDSDLQRMKMLRRAEIPFFEPGLQELVPQGMGGGRLRFAADISGAVGDVFSDHVKAGA